MTYRKWGRAVRFENGMTVRVDEAGEAIDDGGEFRARPLNDRRTLPEVSVPMCDLRAERVVLSEGVAVHETNRLAWLERTRRLHLSVANPPFRMLLDQAHFEVNQRLIDVFARLRERRDPPPRLLLAPRVAAAILHSLIGRIDLAQRAGAFPDGRGERVTTRRVTTGEPPNWYRPSYRVRPIRAWLNLAPLPFGEIDPSVPRAIALLGAEEVLCVDERSVFATELRVGRVLAAGIPAEWFPYAAGAWGAEMLLTTE